MAVGLSFDDEPTVNSKDELTVATSGSHNLRRRSGADPALPGRRNAGLQLPTFRNSITMWGQAWCQGTHKRCPYLILETLEDYDLPGRCGL